MASPDPRAPTAPPRELIVFSHGNSFPTATYGLMLQSLRERGYDVSAVDQYGHDPRYPVTNNWPHLVEQLRDFTRAALRDRQAGARAWFVGHSLGGLLSLMAAAQHPELARGVVLLDSPLVGGWRAGALGVAKRSAIIGRVSPGATSRRRRDQWASRDAALEHFRSKKVFASWHPQALIDYVDQGTRDDGQGRRVLVFDRDVETAIYNSLPHTIGALLKRHPLQVPAAFIGGTRSRELRQVGMAATRRIVHGRVSMLDGSHLFPMEKPLAAAAAVEAVLRDLGDRPR